MLEHSVHNGSLHFLNNPRTGHRVMRQSSPSYEVEALEFKVSRLTQGLVVNIRARSSCEQAGHQGRLGGRALSGQPGTDDKSGDLAPIPARWESAEARTSLTLRGLQREKAPAARGRNAHAVTSSPS